MNALKQSDNQYRNISGKHFECYTADPSQFARAKKECKAAGLSYRIIDQQFYREVSKQLQTTEEAIETVRVNNEGYHDLALEFAKRWILEKWKPFTSEDLSKEMHLVLEPDEPRVLGSVMRLLADNL